MNDAPILTQAERQLTASIDRVPLVTEPGIYQLSHEHYHSDPTPTGSLSSSGAFTLAMDCPAAYLHERQTKTFKRAFDLGNASHLITLEPDLFADRVVVIRGTTKKGESSKGYQSQDAKEQRDAAYADGKIPLLPDEHDLICAMRRVLAEHPIGRVAFKSGKAEQSIFWQDQEFGIWCRTRPDWIPSNPRYLINWKSAASAHPDDIAKAIYNLGYFAKSAWEMDGFEAVTGERPEKFCLLVQAKAPPYLITPSWLDREDLDWGRIVNRYARAVYAWCSQRNEWPGYQPDITEPVKAFETIRMPEWARRDLQRRHEAGEFTPPQERVAA